jgi:hypothetical protein
VTSTYSPVSHYSPSSSSFFENAWISVIGQRRWTGRRKTRWRRARRLLCLTLSDRRHTTTTTRRRTPIINIPELILTPTNHHQHPDPMVVGFLILSFQLLPPLGCHNHHSHQPYRTTRTLQLDPCRVAVAATQPHQSQHNPQHHDPQMILRHGNQRSGAIPLDELLHQTRNLINLTQRHLEHQHQQHHRRKA